MNARILIGIALVGLGIAALIFKSFSYTSRETVLEVGPVRAEADMKKRVPISPIAGAVAIVGGVVLIATGSRKRSI